LGRKKQERKESDAGWAKMLQGFTNGVERKEKPIYKERGQLMFEGPGQGRF